MRRHKLQAQLSVLKLQLSDERLQQLCDVTRHVPLPHSHTWMTPLDHYDDDDDDDVIDNSGYSDVNLEQILLRVVRQVLLRPLLTSSVAILIWRFAEWEGEGVGVYTSTVLVFGGQQ